MAKAEKYELPGGGSINTGLCSMEVFRQIEARLQCIPDIDFETRKRIREELIQATEANAAQTGDAVELAHFYAAIDAHSEIQSLLQQSIPAHSV